MNTLGFACITEQQPDRIRSITVFGPGQVEPVGGIDPHCTIRIDHASGPTFLALTLQGVADLHTNLSMASDMVILAWSELSRGGSPQ